jgi:hypothetical protein
MSDLSSEKKSLAALPYGEALDLVLEIRAKRRHGIISASQRRATKVKTGAKEKSKAKAKTSAEKAISSLSADDAAKLLAQLLEANE